MQKIVKLILLLFSTFCFSQQKFMDSVINPLQKNQLLFEKVFIHTNKISFFNDDIIWFKAYVGGNSNNPSLKTTLLYVNLLDGNGKLIFSNNVLIHKGVGQGQFKLNGVTNSKEVYLQVYTNHMRNFGEENYYLQKIKIINNSVVKKDTLKNKYDIQIFPEGGYLLEDTENVLGIKSLINGKGVKFSGKIVDSENNNISSFKNTHLGMTKCSFFYKSDEEYNIVVTINDTIVKKKISKARKQGVILNIDNSNDEYLSLDIKTNKKTLKESQVADYKLLFHQRNQVVDFLEISNLDSLNFHLEIEKKTFFNGVNTLTVFKGLRPISERKFYIEKPTQEPQLRVSKERIVNDSIKYKIQILDYLKQPLKLKANLSVSVLLLNSQNNEERTNIKSAFLLSPYVKGHIENPSNYFNRKNKYRKKQLDLLLLTQGWSQYSAKKMITDLNPKETYIFEQGFRLTGTATPLLTNFIGLMTENNILIDKLFLNGKADFSFDKLLVYKGDSVKISFLDNQNIAMKPKNILIDSLKFTKFPKLNIQKEYLVRNKKTITNDDLLEKIDSDITKLDVVKLKGKKRSEKYKERKKTIDKYKSTVLDIGKYYFINTDKKSKYNSDLMTFLLREENVIIVNWNGIENYLSTPGGEAILYIDGRRIHSDELNGVFIKMEDIENIGVASKEKRKSKVYQVFTTENYKNNIQELFVNFVIQNGYDKSQKYYTPIYDFNFPKKWQEVDWKPELITNDLGEIYFKVRKGDNLNGYQFSINGFSENGILINSNINTL